LVVPRDHAGSSAFRIPKDPLALAAAGVLFVALVFGGASRVNELRLALVELAALPLLAAGLWRLYKAGGGRGHRFALVLAGATILIPLLQLVPLPLEVWRTLPGRGEINLALELTDVDVGWLPMSLTPSHTWASTLALIPPLAVFVSALGVSRTDQRFLVAAILIGAVANILLGVGQIASGGQAQLYPYDGAQGSVVGFFANRNHLATLLLMALPLAGAFVGSALHEAQGDRRLQIALAIIFVMLAVVAIGIVQSRAGVLLGVPALIAGGAIAWAAATSIGRRWAMAGMGLVGLASIAAVVTFASSRLFARFDQDLTTDDRFEGWSVVIQGADKYLPVGSGIGSFDPVYRSIEPPETLQATFLNHAHNEYLELWLEAGWTAGLLVLLFLVWLVRRTVDLGRADRTHAAIGFAATTAIGLVLAHSFFDYPLRTEAIACAFAVCCAVLEQSSLSEQSRVPGNATREPRRGQS